MMMTVNIDGRDTALHRYDLTVEQIRFANEVGHKTIVRFIVELPRCPLLSNRCVPHDNNLVRDGQCFLLIMGHIDNS